MKYYWKYESKLRDMNIDIGLNIAYSYQLMVDLLQSKLFILIPFRRNVNVLIVQTLLMIKINWAYQFLFYMLVVTFVAPSLTLTDSTFCPRSVLLYCMDFRRRSRWPRGVKLGSMAGLTAAGTCLSLVKAACCQVEVSASGWSLVQRSPTECGVSERGREE
jgi:hypothetical protein